jgi:DNA-binding MarR family transcriptional regulator
MTSDQEKLRSLGPCNATALRKAARHVTQLYDTVLAETGLRSTQRSILAQIARTEGAGITELADAMVYDRSSFSHNLQPLVRDGFVAVEQHPKDKRTKAVRLTPLGRERLEQSNALWKTAQERFEAVFGVQEAKELRDTLMRVVAVSF